MAYCPLKFKSGESEWHFFSARQSHLRGRETTFWHHFSSPSRSLLPTKGPERERVWVWKVALGLPFAERRRRKGCFHRFLDGDQENFQADGGEKTARSSNKIVRGIWWRIIWPWRKMSVLRLAAAKDFPFIVADPHTKRWDFPWGVISILLTVSSNYI